MVGIDILEIERLERRLARHPRLAERLFTPGERAYAAAQARPGQHLAARFCAKEAAFKALSLDVLRPHEIEVVSSGGRPELVLHGKSREQAAGVQLHASLAHERGLATAVVLAR